MSHEGGNPASSELPSGFSTWDEYNDAADALNAYMVAKEAEPEEQQTDPSNEADKSVAQHVNSEDTANINPGDSNYRASNDTLFFDRLASSVHREETLQYANLAEALKDTVPDLSWDPKDVHDETFPKTDEHRRLYALVACKAIRDTSNVDRSGMADKTWDMFEAKLTDDKAVQRAAFKLVQAVEDYHKAGGPTSRSTLKQRKSKKSPVPVHLWKGEFSNHFGSLLALYSKHKTMTLTLMNDKMDPLASTVAFGDARAARVLSNRRNNAARAVQLTEMQRKVKELEGAAQHNADAGSVPAAGEPSPEVANNANANVKRALQSRDANQLIRAQPAKKRKISHTTSIMPPPSTNSNPSLQSNGGGVVGGLLPNTLSSNRANAKVPVFRDGNVTGPTPHQPPNAPSSTNFITPSQHQSPNQGRASIDTQHVNYTAPSSGSGANYGVAGQRSPIFANPQLTQAASGQDGQQSQTNRWQQGRLR